MFQLLQLVFVQVLHPVPTAPLLPTAALLLYCSVANMKATHCCFSVELCNVMLSTAAKPLQAQLDCFGAAHMYL